MIDEGETETKEREKMSEKPNKGLIAGTLAALGAVGRRNAVTRTVVARALGMASRDGQRIVSKLLEAERSEGVICSCGRGIFIPADSAEGDREVAAYIAEVSRKGAGSFKSIRGAKKYLAQREREKSGQMDLSEVAKGTGSEEAERD